MELWEDLQWRGMVHQCTDPELPAKLAGDRFTVYTGFDASADSLHAGHLVPIMGLRRFQRAGHRPIALLGGATTMIGDPSGRATERPLLSVDEIAANIEGLRRQLERFLDFSPGRAQAVMANNADWLVPLVLVEFLRDVGKHFTVNAMLGKESVRSRLSEREQGISYTEFSYMLLQAYDFLHLFDLEGCRLQLGGSDQWGNVTAGIELIRRVRREEAYGLTWPLLTRSDGTKFGKSEGANVWLDPRRTSPYRFFQYWVSTPDEDVATYMRLLADLDTEEVAEVLRRPRDAQRRLAYEVTALVHGREEAERARRASEALFGAAALAELDAGLLAEVFAEAPSTVVARQELEGTGVSLVDLLVRTGLAPSKSAARTAVAQGGVYLNDERQGDPERNLEPGDLLGGRWVVARRGRKNYHVVQFEDRGRE
jgi:tyrosyl-tRNA synthetase